MNHARTRRRGYNLIELMAVIACLSVVLTLTAGLMHQMLKLDRGGRNRAVAASSLERLGQALRADAHAATGAVETKADRLVIPLEGDRIIDYRVRSADVVRTVRQAGKVRGFEIYARPKGTSARFDASREGASTFVSLHVATSTGIDADPLYRGYRIDAETGRHPRQAKEVMR
jgi:prepilin-type N-terminal cleavage/methylation domain-containing protein